MLKVRLAAASGDDVIPATLNAEPGNQNTKKFALLVKKNLNDANMI